MEEPFTLHMDDIPVRFTPDGKVSIIDAIKATMQSNRARAVWETLKAEHPEVLDYCDDYPFRGKAPVPVVDSAGWEKIMELLIYELAAEEEEGQAYSASAG